MTQDGNKCPDCGTSVSSPGLCQSCQDKKIAEALAKLEKENERRRKEK